MNILQSTFDKHKKLMLEHIEELYEGSLIQNPKFLKDYEILVDEFKKLFFSSDVEKTVEDAKKLSPFEYEVYGGYTQERRVKTNLDDKLGIKIKIAGYPEKYHSAGHYDPQTDSIVFVFYKDTKFLSKKFEINDDFDIKKFYNQYIKWINKTIAHELSHAYKERFRSRKHSKAFVSPKDVALGKKNLADYAQYDDERESYLAEMWTEMLDLKKENPDIDFFNALRNSYTFLSTLEDMGGEGNVKPKYRKNYIYFLKKLTELWQNAGYKVTKQDINQAVEAC